MEFSRAQHPRLDAGWLHRTSSVWHLSVCTTIEALIEALIDALKELVVTRTFINLRLSLIDVFREIVYILQQFLNIVR